MDNQQAPGASASAAVPPPPPGFVHDQQLPLTNFADAAAAEVAKRQAAGTNVTPSENAAILSAYRTNYTGAPLPAPNQTLQQVQQQAAPDNSTLQNISGAVGHTLGNTAVGIVGAVAPQTAMHMREQRDAAYAPADPNAVATHATNLLAGVVEGAPAMLGGPAGLAYSAVGAAGNARTDVAERRAAGEKISGSAEAANALGSGALDLAANYAGQKLLGKVGGDLMKSFGADAAKAIAAGDTKLLASILAKAGFSAMGKEAFGNTGIGIAHQVAHNAISKYTYDPARDVFTGVPQAGVDSFITSVLLSPIAALKARSETLHEGITQNEAAAPPAPSKALATAVGATESPAFEKPTPEDHAKIREAAGALEKTLTPEGADRQRKLVADVQNNLAGGDTENPFPAHPLVDEAAPKYRITEGEKSRGVPLTFADPVEKALYLATQPRTGKVSLQAMDFLQGQGWKDQEITDAGQELRNHIDTQAEGFTGDTLHVDPNAEAKAAPAGNASDATAEVPAAVATERQAPVEKASSARPQEQRTPSEDIRQQAADYTKSAGINYNPDTTYADVDPTRAKSIADAFEQAKHTPNNPKVKKSYAAFKRETMDQYHFLSGKGVKFEPWTGEGQPYANSKEMTADVRDNQHLYFYTGGDLPNDHPLAAKAPGTDFTYNDIFRAVHDYFGHAKEGVGFGPRGEENAWRTHSQMYSPEAQPAMTAETRGQNSWVNFGPHGEFNRANPDKTVYAQQKATLLPERFNTLNGEAPPASSAKFPKSFDDANGVAEWASQFDPDVKEAGDTDTAAITSSYFGGELKHLEGAEGQFVKATVPLSLVEPREDYQPENVKAYAAEDAKTSPPAIGGYRDGKFVLVDGNTRARAAKVRGDDAITAYIPASSVGRDGITAEGVKPKRPVAARAGFVALPDPAAIAKGVHALAMHEGSFIDQDVLPAVKRGINGVKQLVDGAERFLGSGALNKTGETLRNSLRDSWGKQDLDRVRTEQLFKPALDLAKTYSEDANTQAIEAIEAGQAQPDSRMQPYADLLRRLAKKNMADAKTQGIDVSKWDSNADWVGRMFEWPDQKEGNGRFSSIAGAENHLKSRVFENYGDALAAVKATGGKPKYDNFIETSLAKQMEIRKSIEGRRVFNEAEGRGELSRIKPGDDLPAGYKYLDDKLSRSLGGGQRYAAPAYTANLLNDTISLGLNQRLPLWKQWAALNHAVTAVNLGLSGAHMMNMVTGSMGLNASQVLDNLRSGEFTLAGKNLLRTATAPITTALLGSKVREQAQTASAHPELEPIVKAIATNGRFGFRSVLEPSSLEKAQDAFKSGNYVGGTARLAKAAWEGLSYPLFHMYIPNIKAGVLAIRAETELSRMGPTIDQAELTKRMQQHSDLADNVLGEVVRENKFQHKIVQDAAQGIFMAPNWTEGLLRFMGGSARDYVRAGLKAATGSMPEVTPRMLAPYGQVLSIMAAGAATHLLFNHTMPQTLRDYFQPKSGQKDEDGNDIRLQMLTPMKDVPNLAREPGNVLWNKMTPLIHMAHDIAVNHDYHGVEIRHKGDSAGDQAEQIGKYAGKALLPFTVQSYQRMNDAGASTGKKLLGAAGLSPVPKVYDQSPALQKAYGFMDETPGRVRTQAEYDRHTLIGQLSRGLANPAKQSAARGQIRDAVRTGELLPSDVDAIKRRMKYPDPLVRAVRSSSLSLDQGMQVWDVADDAEKRAIGPALLSRIRNSKDTPREDKVRFVKRLQADWQRLRLAVPTSQETTNEAD